MEQPTLRPAQQRNTGSQPVSIAPSRIARSGGRGWWTQAASLRYNELILLRNAVDGAILPEVRCRAW